MVLSCPREHASLFPCQS